MRITLKMEIVAPLYTKSKVLHKFMGWNHSRVMKEKDYKPSDTITIDLVDMNRAELIELKELLADTLVPVRSFQTLQNWITNMDNPDDAILSRTTLHIKYSAPTQSESQELWKTLSANFELKISDETILSIWDKYQQFSGRDIRNTLKDIVKLYPKSDEVVLEQVEELAEFLPFCKERI